LRFRLIWPTVRCVLGAISWGWEISTSLPMDKYPIHVAPVEPAHVVCDPEITVSALTIGRPGILTVSALILAPAVDFDTS